MRSNKLGGRVYYIQTIVCKPLLKDNKTSNPHAGERRTIVHKLVGK